MSANPIGDQVINNGIAFGVVCSIAVFLRLLARAKTKANLAADDFLIALSLGPLWGMVTIGCLAVSISGMGLPIDTLSPWQMSTFSKFMMATIGTYALTITMVRISILILYRRVFATAAFRKKTVVVAALCLTWFCVIVLLDVLQCHPIADTFIYPRPNTCINLQNFLWAMTTSNLVLDLIMLCLPLHMVWSLDLPRSEKAFLYIVFSLGGLACFASAMRIVKIGNLSEEDITVTQAAEYIWSQIEPGIAILSACLSTYRPLITGLLSKLRGKTKSTSISIYGGGLTPRDSPIEAERAFYLQHLAERSPQKINRFFDLNTQEYSAELMEEGEWSPHFRKTEFPRDVEVLGAPPGMSPYAIHV